MVALGGRAAEEIIYGEDHVTTGASSDLEKATDMALSMIGVYGMDNETGLLNYNVLQNRALNHDESILIRAKEILESLYAETKNTLEKYRSELDALTNALLEKEVLDEEDVNKLTNSFQI